LVLGFSFGKIFSQCTETSEPKILLVGDSWAWYMNTDGTINTVLKTWGHSNYKFISNANLAINGADTKDFIKPDAEAEILNQLTLNPTIEAVHLSIGGNDFLGDWNVSMTQAQTDSLTDGVFVRLDSIIRFIKSCKPGIKVLWSAYCYTNFKEVITGPGGLGSSHPFYGTWHGMGDPDFIQINTMQNSISVKIDDYCATHSDVYFVNAVGLMQYVYGQPTALTVAPGGTYAAHSVPLPLGDPNYPSPKVSMRLYLGVVPDCYHLSAEGYRYLLAYHTQKFYHKLFMDDLYLLSDSSTMGSVSSQGNVSATPYLGETSGEQFATVLSFNTTSMADTTLRKASIFIRRKTLTGTNPISGTLEVKVKNGNFGTTVNVEAADFAANGDAAATPCLYGSYANNGDWARLDLPASILSHINHTGVTQFVISAPNFSGGKVEFYDSSDPEFAPVLNLAYGAIPSGISETSNNPAFHVYPNPTNGLLTVEGVTEVITHAEITNLLGEVVLQSPMQHNTINISSLAAGIYILNVTTKTGKASQRIVKE